MTALEKYIEDHPEDIWVVHGGMLPANCPSLYGYLDDPTWCNFEDGRDCNRCWNRRIPENKEKENEDMSHAAAYVKDLEAKIEELRKLLIEKDTEILNLNAVIEEKNARFHDTLVEHGKEMDDLKRRFNATQGMLADARDMIRHLKMVIRTVEALTDHDILEDC